MPEGDTLRKLADRIDARLAGQAVTWSRFRHPRLATADLAGARLLEADAYGKHLFCRFDDGRSLHVHLLMDGVVSVGERRDVDERSRRFELRFEQGHLTGVDIPLLHLIDTADEAGVVADLGPDLCGFYDHSAAVARFLDARDQRLGAAMLDQRVVAGFGNIYAIEVPFICGVSPFAPVGDLSGTESLLSIGAALIRTNAERGPRNTTGRRLATDHSWIAPRRVYRCPVCGERIERLSDRDSPWGRRSVWCPSCQSSDHSTVDIARARRMLSLHPARRLLDVDTMSLASDTSSKVATWRG